MQGFRGQGYSPQFIANLARLINKLESDRKLKVQLVSGVDDVCSACPHMDAGNCKCPDHDVNDLDIRVANHIGVAHGQSGTWADLQQLIGARVRPDDIDQLCEGCRWTGFDYCHNAIAALGQGPDVATGVTDD